jgi:hypothetical protein
MDRWKNRLLKIMEHKMNKELQNKLKKLAANFIVNNSNLESIELINEEAIYFVYQLLQQRKIHPAGDFDNAKRWYSAHPDACTSSRSPSRAYPFSLMNGCRTKGYVTTRAATIESTVTVAELVKLI